MYFTREPIVETVITSREGYKLVLRNSKGGGQEEYFVDAVEVITFGKNCFYRSLERPKSFLLPISDYEIVEARETKMVLKTPSLEKGIKIGGGREGTLRSSNKEEVEEKKEETTPSAEHAAEPIKNDKKREKRRFKKRKEREEGEEMPSEGGESSNGREEKVYLIPPPATLISETISKYKDLPGFSGAFFDREGKEDELSEEVSCEEINLEEKVMFEPANVLPSDESEDKFPDDPLI